MGKKKKGKGGGAHFPAEKTDRQPKKRLPYPFIAMAVGAVVLLSGVFFSSGGKRPKKFHPVNQI